MRDREPIEVPDSVLDGWHQRLPKWRIVGQSYTTTPTVEDDGVIRVTTAVRVATMTFTLERDTEDGPPERQTVTVSGCLVIADPPTILLAFPLESV